jgi:hypothetical protein
VPDVFQAVYQLKLFARQNYLDAAGSAGILRLSRTQVAHQRGDRTDLTLVRVKVSFVNRLPNSLVGSRLEQRRW